MLRKFLPLMFLLILVASNTALGGRHGRRRCCPCPCPCQTPEPAPVVSSYCLQEKYMDFAGNYDLYLCSTYDLGCPSKPDSPYEDLYYGPSHFTLPQICDDCEAGDKGIYQGQVAKKPGGGKGPTGHTKDFRTKIAACNYLTGNGGVASGQTCKYYELPKSESHLSKDFCFVMARVNTPNGPRYFGVQTRDLPDTPETASFANCDILHEDGNAKVLTFDVTIGGTTTKGLVWLK